MPGNLSDYAENLLLDWLFSAVGGLTRPTSWYMALHVGPPGENGLAGEIGSGKGYARKPITFGVSLGGVKTNNLVADFGPSTAAWGTVTHFSIWDAVSGGNMLAWGTLTSSQAVQLSGKNLPFQVGTVRVAAD